MKSSDPETSFSVFVPCSNSNAVIYTYLLSLRDHKSVNMFWDPETDLKSSKNTNKEKQPLLFGIFQALSA